MRRPTHRPLAPYHEEYLRRALAGLTTPAEIENELKAKGLQPLAMTPDPDQYDPMAEVWWTLAMSLAWIIFRTPHAVRQAWWAYRGEFRIWSDPREIEFMRDGHREICMGYELLRSYDLSVGEISGQYFYHRVNEKAVMAGEDALSSLWRNLESGQVVAEGVRDGKARSPIRDAEWIDLRAFLAR